MLGLLNPHSTHQLGVRPGLDDTLRADGILLLAHLAAAVLALAPVGSEPIPCPTWAEHGLVVDVLWRSQSAAGHDQHFPSVGRRFSHRRCISSARLDRWVVSRSARGMGCVRCRSKLCNLATERLKRGRFSMQENAGGAPPRAGRSSPSPSTETRRAVLRAAFCRSTPMRPTRTRTRPLIANNGSSGTVYVGKCQRRCRQKECR